MKNNFAKTTSQIKYKFQDIFKAVKWQLIFSIAIVVIGLVCGMIFGFANLGADYINDNLLSKFLTGSMSSFSCFLQRILIEVLVLLLLFLLSSSIWLLPLGLLIIFYRAYVIGLNLSILIMFYGVLGLVFALILFVFELLILLLMTFFYVVLTFGKNCIGLLNKKNFILVLFGLIVILNILLCLILFIFSPNVIFVL